MKVDNNSINEPNETKELELLGSVEMRGDGLPDGFALDLADGIYGVRRRVHGILSRPNQAVTDGLNYHLQQTQCHPFWC